MLDPEALQAIRQALGLDRAVLPYRNHYPAPADDALALELVRRGLMEAGPATPGQRVLFRVTEAGARRAGTLLPMLDPGQR